MKMKHSLCLAAASVLVTLGCATAKDSKQPFMKEDMIEAEAMIQMVDPTTRTLIVDGPSGPTAIVCGPEVRNFDQIHAGEKVKLTYKAALAAAITKSKAKPTDTYDAAAVSAPLGEKPAAAVGQTITTTVQIESVDTSFDTVSFKRPDGYVRTIAVESPEGKKFIRTLKKGDMVDVSYTEALAISVVMAE
jgi:hypothetical protein